MNRKVTYGSPGPRWMRQAAEDESRCPSVTVGGLASELSMIKGRKEDDPHVLGRLVEWRRLELGMTERQLATAAGLDVAEVQAIEQDDPAALSVRVVFKLANALRLPPQRLAVVAGLAEARDDRGLAEATVRFAAKSSTARLSRQQRRVLKEYVRVLSRSPGED